MISKNVKRIRKPSKWTGMWLIRCDGPPKAKPTRVPESACMFKYYNEETFETKRMTNVTVRAQAN